MDQLASWQLEVLLLFSVIVIVMQFGQPQALNEGD